MTAFFCTEKKSRRGKKGRAKEIPYRWNVAKSVAGCLIVMERRVRGGEYRREKKLEMPKGGRGDDEEGLCVRERRPVRSG